MFDVLDGEDNWVPCQPLICQTRSCAVTKLCWSHFYHTNGLKIYRYLYSILHNRDEATDCLQETFKRFFENIDKFNPEKPLLPYLLRIARNTAYNSVRRKRPLLPLELIAESHTASLYSESDILQDIALDQAIEWIMQHVGLDETQSTIFVYTAVDGLKPKEIAFLMDEHPPKIRKKLHAIRQQIRLHLDRPDLDSIL